VAATHGIFAGDAMAKIQNSAIDQLYVTDTLPLPASASSQVEVVSVAPLLAEAITRTHKGLSISALFT
jgi:ribose-phosphate pyrophosphokinase